MMNNTIKLGNFISEYSVRNRAGDDIPVYSVTNKEGFCRDYFSKDVASQDRSTYKIVPRGCFAYNPSRINVGSVDWQRKEDRVIVSPLYVVFSVSKGLDQQYLYYYLKSEKCLYYIKELASGSVRDNLKLSMLKEFTIPNITLEEQRKAVMVLEQTDRLIALQERQMTVLDELVKSRFVEMFGDPLTKTKYPKRQISDLGIVGTGNTPSMRVSEYYESEDIPFIKPGDIAESGVTIVSNADTAYISESARKAARIMPYNTVMVTCIGTIGKVGIVQRESACNQQINYIIPNALINSMYLAQCLSFYKPVLEEMANAPVVPIINKTQFSTVALPVPPLELQNCFAAFVAEVDKSKLAVKQSLEKLETLKKSLMQQYFG